MEYYQATSVIQKLFEPYKTKTEGIGLVATRLLPIDIKWLFPGTVAVVEISLTALVSLARVDVHASENDTFHVFSQIPGGTITGIRCLQ